MSPSPAPGYGQSEQVTLNQVPRATGKRQTSRSGRRFARVGRPRGCGARWWSRGLLAGWSRRAWSPALFSASRPCPVARLTTQLTEGPEPLRDQRKTPAVTRPRPALGSPLTRPGLTPASRTRARSEILTRMKTAPGPGPSPDPGHRGRVRWNVMFPGRLGQREGQGQRG